MTAATIGHSNRTAEEFLALLGEHGITHLVDVRRLPGSRRYPWFDQENLRAALEASGVVYTHQGALTGRRRTPAGTPSINGGWENASFRAYADHMQTDEFHAAADRLAQAAQREPVAVMCSEAVPWRCHRRMIADALLVRGIAVTDVIGPNSARPHELTPFARREGTRLWYPPESD
ncbi:DUF488 family protein [Pseudactinotalea sp. HY160]|uniref:DUF488 domain-containing protein n=1 Tax=Pseudactinotalea sp. HY160 TaxID=2654490 RepID=UPI00128C0272|nr:DUF488 domain-containing protein [Pseudactinotalea sp. HY160]MPV49707.1 DUF488 family protein [Pseudactinotalea sp. HY160]